MTATLTTDVQRAIKAAMSIAKDLAEGRVTPGEVDAATVAECEALVGRVVGDGEPLWPLQCDVARQVLAAGGIPVDELAEWLAVARTRAGLDVVPAAPSWIEQMLAAGPDCVCPPSTAGGLAVDCPAHPDEVDVRMLGRCRCGEPNCGGEHVLTEGVPEL